MKIQSTREKKETSMIATPLYPYIQMPKEFNKIGLFSIQHVYF